MMLLTFKRCKRINQNELAMRVKKREGGKEKISIAQVKEVQGILLDILADEIRSNPHGVLDLLRRRRDA